MKERFEGLSAWKEKQKEERGFLEKRLEEAKQRIQILDSEKELLRKRVQEMEKQHSGAEEARMTFSFITASDHFYSRMCVKGQQSEIPAL